MRARRSRRSSRAWRATTRASRSGCIDGEDLRRFVNVYVNDEDVRFTGGLETSVADGDQVVVLPAVAGGAR